MKSLEYLSTPNLQRKILTLSWCWTNFVTLETWVPLSAAVIGLVLKTIFCTKGTVDQFNAKSVQSTMGSIARVELIYATSEEIFERLKFESFEIYCADMAGVDYRKVESNNKRALVMGSESHGPSEFWKNKASAITIHKEGKSKIESLNVAVATSILHFELELKKSRQINCRPNSLH